MSRNKAGFSLIELLVVILIISIGMGLYALSTRKVQRGSQVRAEAESLAAVLRNTRHQAIAKRTTYAVVFHLQNEPGSSGAVLNNRSGGHWYRVLGPSTMTRYNQNVPDTIPWAGCKRMPPTGDWRSTNFPDFVAEVQRCWVAEPHVLPARSVRFLALGDTDEGPRIRSQNPAQCLYYGSGGETTYPRPWFGYFDPGSGTLWPWGGYSPGKSASGFFYEGADGAVVGSLNPVDRSANHDWNSDLAWVDADRNGDGDLEDFGERDLAWPICTAGQPRPVVDSGWLDACIVFKPDGSAFFAEWNRGRRAYANISPPTPNPVDFRFIGGLDDRAKPSPPDYRYKPLTNAAYGECPYEIGEVAHFEQHTGGWHITLAPDSLDDRTQFPSAVEALASMSPMWRVYISASGVVQVFPVGERRGYLKALKGAGKAWPANPSDWLDVSSTTANKVYRNCRLGYLNTPGTTAPMGTAISNIVDPDMLAERVWWKLP